MNKVDQILELQAENERLGKKIKETNQYIVGLLAVISTQDSKIEELNRKNQFLTESIVALGGIDEDALRECARKLKALYNLEPSKNSKKRWKQEGKKWQN